MKRAKIFKFERSKHVRKPNVAKSNMGKFIGINFQRSQQSLNAVVELHKHVLWIYCAIESSNEIKQNLEKSFQLPFKRLKCMFRNSTDPTGMHSAISPFELYPHYCEWRMAFGFFKFVCRFAIRTCGNANILFPRLRDRLSLKRMELSIFCLCILHSVNCNYYFQ